MRIPSKIKTFNDKYPLMGPGLWILTVEYFIIQLVVALAWKTPYSISKNTISDLGNTQCGVYDSRYVCSPFHNLMNAAFISLGVFMVMGSLLIYQEFKETKLALVGFSCLLIGGVGTIIVGSCPENTILFLHSLGAFLPFLIGNLGILILGISIKIPIRLRIFTLFAGTIALVALVLFITNRYLGLGEGGMERIVAYPQTVWLIVFGVYISKNHYAKPRRRAKR
jgi:hypothetical membrane protein